MDKLNVFPVEWLLCFCGLRGPHWQAGDWPSRCTSGGKRKPARYHEILMDRRTWLQLLGLLSSATAASPDQPPAGGRGAAAGQGPQAPMRVQKEQVAGALALLGLEFQDAEIDMMMR